MLYFADTRLAIYFLEIVLYSNHIGTLHIVTCRPFLGNEWANTLSQRDLFLETNWLRNVVSRYTETESCKHLENQTAAWELRQGFRATHSRTVMEPPLEAVVSIRFSGNFEKGVDSWIQVAPNVNSLPLDKMFRLVVKVVHRIMTEFNGAALQEAKVVAITKLS
jgi:hypothetical protein